MKIAIHTPRVSYYHGGAEQYILNMVLRRMEEGYVKCKDEYGNQPAPSECNIVVRAIGI